MSLRACTAASSIILALSGSASAAIVTFDSEPAFLTAAAGLEVRGFNFEAPPFPDASSGTVAFVGSIGGVAFDTHISAGPSALSGVQTSLGSFADQTFDFSGYGKPVSGFGFFELDLVGAEITRVSVTFADLSVQTFDVGLGGASDFTPIFFGLLTDMSPVRQVVLSGLRDGGAGPVSPSTIDDLSVAAVPLPAPALFLAAALGALAAARPSRRS